MLPENQGLLDYLDCEWTKYDLAATADRARQYAAEIKIALHLSIMPQMSDVQVVHQLLSQLGLRIAFRWRRAITRHECENLRVYRLDTDRYQQAIAILQ